MTITNFNTIHLINIENAIHNTIDFQSQLSDSEQDITNFKKQMENLVSATQKVHANSQNLYQSLFDLSQFINDFIKITKFIDPGAAASSSGLGEGSTSESSKHSENFTKDTFKHLSKIIKETGILFQRFNDQINASIITGLQQFIQTEYSTLKSQKLKYEKHADNYNKMLKSYCDLSKKLVVAEKQDFALIQHRSEITAKLENSPATSISNLSQKSYPSQNNLDKNKIEKISENTALDNTSISNLLHDSSETNSNSHSNLSTSNSISMTKKHSSTSKTEESLYDNLKIEHTMFMKSRLDFTSSLNKFIQNKNLTVLDRIIYFTQSLNTLFKNGHSNSLTEEKFLRGTLVEIHNQTENEKQRVELENLKIESAVNKTLKNFKEIYVKSPKHANPGSVSPKKNLKIVEGYLYKRSSRAGIKDLLN